MGKLWTEDQQLVNNIAENLLEAMTVFPKRLIHLDTLCREFDLPASQLNILFLLARQDLSISELAERTGIAKPNITPLVDALHQKELVERVPSTTDRRVVFLRLLPNGLKRIEEIRNAVSKQIGDWSVTYSRSEARELSQALATLVRLSH